MVHELRIYHCLPGRLPVLLNRFETVTLKLWERHGRSRERSYRTAEKAVG